MQDCDQIINYDLHWNPVRLIQRLGRIDRIGTEHDIVRAYNFLPETELEKQLGLRQKLQSRIQEIHDTIGEDAAILDPEERLNEAAFYAIYESLHTPEIDDSDEDQLVDLNEAQEILRQLKEDQPDLFEHITKLRDGIRCGYEQGRNNTIVLCRGGSFRQLYLADEKGEIINRDIPTILNLMRCRPNTPASMLPAGYNTRVMEVYRSFTSEVRSRLAEQSHTVSLTSAQRYILAQLQALMNETHSTDLHAQISLMSQIFRQPLFQSVKQEINALRSHKVTGLALLEALERIYIRYDLVNQPNYNRQSTTPEPLIVCSEALVD